MNHKPTEIFFLFVLPAFAWISIRERSVTMIITILDYSIEYKAFVLIRSEMQFSLLPILFLIGNKFLEELDDSVNSKN